jgi:hypothetical protein
MVPDHAKHVPDVTWCCCRIYWIVVLDLLETQAAAAPLDGHGALVPHAHSTSLLPAVLTMYLLLFQVLVVAGTAIVGTSDTVCKGGKSDARNPAAGNILVIIAQLIASIQMVIEEKFIGGFKVCVCVCSRACLALSVPGTMVNTVLRVPDPCIVSRRLGRHFRFLHVVLRVDYHVLRAPCVARVPCCRSRGVCVV